MPAVGRAPRTRGGVWAEEALLGYQVLLGIHQVPHVVILQQRSVEGAVQGAGRAQVLVLGRRETAWQPLPSPGPGLLGRRREVLCRRHDESGKGPGREAWDQGGGGWSGTWITTKRWGSLAMRENSVTNSRNRGRHSESIIQPGGGRRLSISVPGALGVRPRPPSPSLSSDSSPKLLGGRDEVPEALRISVRLPF